MGVVAVRLFEQASMSHGGTGGLQDVADASIGGGLALGRRGGLSWRMLLAVAVLSLALAAALYESLPGSGSAQTGAAPAAGLARSQRPSGFGLVSLPATAQGSVSATLGAETAAYRVSGAGGAFNAASPAQRLSSSFTDSGVTVRTGTTRVALRLSGIGYGSSLTALRGVTPRAEGNRVVYAHSGLGEWYVNGPLGLEQGFTLSRAPAEQAVGPLTLAIGLSGNARAALTNGGQSVTLSRAGRVVMRYTGLSATDGRGHLLHTWLGLEAGRILLRVDASGASYPLRIDPLLQQGEKLTGGKETGKGAFGYSVALSGNGRTALIGGPDDNEGVGAAWVFITPVPKFTIEKQQELAGEATYTNSELTAVIGQTVDYRITVANTGDVPLEFSELNDPNCTGISPSGTRTIGSGESQTYTCHHELTASGSYSNQASIEGNEGTGTESSNTVAVTVVRAICTGNSGTVTLAPGLTNTPAVQRMKIKETLTGCRGDTFTGATYTATLTTEGPVSCSVLKEAGEPDSGPAKYKWTPKTKTTKGMLSLRLTETPEVALSGTLESGPYSPLTLSGTVTESYTGGSTCGEKLGKKAAKAVKKGTFSGSTVYFVE